LLGTNAETFYQIDGTVPQTEEYQEAFDFIAGKKKTLMNLAIQTHLICLICHWTFQILSHYEIKVMANIFLMVKMMFYFITTLRIQSAIDFEKGHEATDESQVMAWLTFEVLAFYLNIISMAAFIFIQSFAKFRSIRDRAGLAGDQRKNLDFLVYCKDDIFWWSCWFSQVALCILSLFFRNRVDIDIKWSVIQVFTKHILGAFLIRQLYFNSKFNCVYTKSALVLCVLVNIMLILRYRELKTHGSSWWAPIVLNDIILYFLLFAQMGQEYLTWGNRQMKWREDLLFEQKFRDNTDDSERNIHANIQTIIEKIEEDGLDFDKDADQINERMTIIGPDESVKRAKTMKMSANIYTAAYYAMMKSNKKELKMTESEQFEVFFKALLIFMVQMFFCFCCWFYGNVKWQVFNNVCLQLALIFATLLIHLGCIPGTKTGLYMMKFALCHPEKFSHPEVAFLLGVMQLSAMWIAEVINMMKATQRKTAQELITSYIGFKTIIDVPTIYLGSINNMAIKGKIGAVTATKPRK